MPARCGGFPFAERAFLIYMKAKTTVEATEEWFYKESLKISKSVIGFISTRSPDEQTRLMKKFKHLKL